MPSNESLHLAIQENFNHARHQEILRERIVITYWTAWAASIGFVYSKNGNFADYPLIFLLMALISIPVLMGTMKWSFEFGNHISAINAIALKLDINKSTSCNNTDFNRDEYYSFKEFKGFMSLPLHVPFYLNVAVWLILLECIGFGVSSAIFIYSFSNDYTVNLLNYTIAWSKLYSAFITFTICLTTITYVCWRSYKSFLKDIENRLPHPEPADDKTSNRVLSSNGAQENPRKDSNEPVHSVAPKGGV